jgi:hypothetical protein
LTKGEKMLNETQKKNALTIWQHYVDNGTKFTNASKEYDQTKLDQERNATIPQVLEQIYGLINKTIDMASFKTKVDSINKQYRLWGFKGISGQMYFNLLYNISSDKKEDRIFLNLLIKTIKMPNDITQAKGQIKELAEYAESLAKHVSDKRAAPRIGSTNFFLSYFWQIQNNKKWPIYYISMINVLKDESLWVATGKPDIDYESFYNLNLELLNLFKEKSNNKNLSFWDIEHAFWQWNQLKQLEIEIKPVEKATKKDDKPIVAGGLPFSYIPPIVSVLPLLAENTPEIDSACKTLGQSVIKVFEERIAILFEMLGFIVEKQGQGKGRVPDGIAICPEHHYAIMFDAKSRKDGYSINTDDRAMKEYISQAVRQLKKDGIDKLYFAVISSGFKGEFNEEIRSIKNGTDIREVLFFEADALLTILEQKLRDPKFDLGTEGMQYLLAQSGIIRKKDVLEYFA